ncbi:MAG: amidohydrolase family protein [Clostridiaceae bacterium]|uniref:Amidohydrolase family protein n=1 Tax=Anaerosalibacter bizertensis TaxID=932217 RepID=A0A9Q4FLQ2_9FIRM|nr:amidohydrolase family protein [Anaerosalibacter bizertensis]MBV1820551.1 amidohydrolase family protein [Bacteroidales bacterium MSK.15.36]MBW4827393.1 amidohydrolase family protein [Clostridiaceae bacterium]MBW4860592.1 amidohydrolase family protein [Clostridiaceae bacterium]MBW4868508.1 amidohydrolase family protein [Clostridiaceae bacterium]MCG4566001.1 amidohydrolase family protein [Anaerosalibacter bizertensis]
MLLIRNSKIYTMTGEVMDNKDILIHNGKIIAIGENIKEEAEVLDAEGLIAMPGLIDCHSHIGGISFSRTNSYSDINEMTNKVTPDVQAIYSVDIDSKDFEIAYENGITTLGITPGSGNVISGLAFATKTYGKNIFEMTVKNPIALKVALGGNPKGNYGKRNQEPATRMSIPNIMKKLLRQAEVYMDKKEKAKINKDRMPEYDEKLEAIIPVLKKEIPLKMHCTQFDMLTSIEIAKEFDLNFTLEHAWGASNYIEEIVESGCGVVFGPVGSMKTFGESSLIDIESVVELDKRNVLVALTTDAPFLSIDSLIHHAGEVVREGCDIERALRMITINPAKIMGIEDRVGSIEEGKDADIVLFRGVPAYDTNAKVIYTIIDGDIVYSSNISCV